jgi:hypothetical protein
MRQSPPVDVPIERLDEGEFRALLTADREGRVEPPVDHFSRALSVLGLTPRSGVSSREQIDDLVENVGGVYRPNEKRVVIVDHGTPADSALTDTLLVHELIHALQDADFDFEAWVDAVPNTYDAALAARTVFEGEASFYQYRAAMPLFGLDWAEVDFPSALEQHLRDELERALDAEDVQFRGYMTVPYGMGALASFTAWQEAGPRGIDRRWASPPGSMQRVMAELFGQDTPIDTGVEIAAPAIDGLDLYGRDVLGAWSLYALFTRKSALDAVGSSLGWRGDRFSVYTRADQATFALWQLELESAEAASRASTLIPLSSLIAREHSGSRVYFAFGYDDAPPAALIAAGDAWLREPP